MVANNSSGAHCLGYGNTIDFLQEVRVVYSDGNSRLVNSSRTSAEKEDHRITDLLRLLSDRRDLISKGYPRVNEKLLRLSS